MKPQSEKRGVEVYKPLVMDVIIVMMQPASYTPDLAASSSLTLHLTQPKR